MRVAGLLILLVFPVAIRAKLSAKGFRHHFIAREMPGTDVGFGAPGARRR